MCCVILIQFMRWYTCCWYLKRNSEIWILLRLRDLKLIYIFFLDSEYSYGTYASLLPLLTSHSSRFKIKVRQRKLMISIPWVHDLLTELLPLAWHSGSRLHAAKLSLLLILNSERSLRDSFQRNLHFPDATHTHARAHRLSVCVYVYMVSWVVRIERPYFL
jgi:hypothetical protein